MNAKELLQAGKLLEAVTACTDEVKKSPTDSAKRYYLAELFCLSGQLERADKQLETIGQQAPDAMLGVSLFRQLIRAETARQQFFSEGRVPELVQEPNELFRLHMQASIDAREGQLATAAESLAKAEELRPHVRGTCEGKTFEDFRDLDDLTAGYFEVLTSTGKYYWIPVDRVEHIDLKKPERPRDILWQQCHMTVTDGPDGEVYLPAIYAGTYAHEDHRLWLGRATDWTGGEGEPARGQGLRTLLIGDEARPQYEITEVDFEVAPSAAK